MRRLLQIATAALLVWAALVYASGGIEWRIGKTFLRSRDAARVLYPAALLVLVQALAYRRESTADLDRATAWARRHAAWIGAAAALALLVHAARHGTFVAGGADAYGYVSQAYWFGIAPDAALPWPLIARMRQNGGVSVLDLASQAVAVTPVSLEPSGRREWRPPEPLRR